MCVVFRIMLMVGFLLPTLCAAQVFAPGTICPDGTYVPPHYRVSLTDHPCNFYRHRPGLDANIPLAGRTPPLSLQPFFDAQRHRQEMELRQLEIEERRRALNSGR